VKIENLSHITPLIMSLSKDAIITQLSSQLTNHIAKKYLGLNLFESFDFIRPNSEFLDKNPIQNMTSHLFLFKTKENNFGFRGQLVRQDDDNYWLILTPWLTWLLKNKSNIRLDLNDFMLIDSQLELNVFLGTQKMMMEDLGKLAEELQESNNTQSRFLDTMSHELRTPLHAIISAAEILELDINFPSSKYIRTILSSCHILLGSINQVLDYSKSKNFSLQQENGPVELVDLCSKIISVFESRSFSEKVSFITNISIPENLPLLYGDQTKISNSLINLLSNAFKYTKEGKIIFNVSATENEEKKINLRFEVQDEGIGIAEEELSNLFTPFNLNKYNSNNSKTFTSSTGLGLSITKNYIETMGGEIGYSRPVEKKGSIFHISLTLPKYKKTRKNINSPLSLNNILENNSPPKILVVDDNPLNCKLTRLQLIKLGVEVVEVNSGYEALEALNTQPFDLVLLDLQMPEIDGFETAFEIRKLPDLSNLPLIAWSATSSNEIQEKTIAYGFSGYLSKPTTIKMIQEMLYASLGTTAKSVS